MSPQPASKGTQNHLIEEFCAALGIQPSVLIFEPRADTATQQDFEMQVDQFLDRQAAAVGPSTLCAAHGAPYCRQCKPGGLFFSPKQRANSKVRMLGKFWDPELGRIRPAE